MTNSHTSSPPLLIFTDLDGSLLDHHTYGHGPADEILQRVARLGIPVIPTTSKTRAEVASLRVELNNHDPFIVENGAAVYLPKAMFPHAPDHTQSDDTGHYWVHSQCEPRSHWQGLIEAVSVEFANQFSTYQKGGISAIMEWTGLSKSQAEKSAEREFGEPVRWLGADEGAQEFSSRLESLGATVLQGGRFLHVSGACNKGSALLWLAREFNKLHGAKRIPTIAAGDSPNDIAMLEAADYAVIVRSPSHLAPDLHPSKGGSERLVVTKSTGPQGWAEGVAYFVTKLQKSM